MRKFQILLLAIGGLTLTAFFNSCSKNTPLTTRQLGVEAAGTALTFNFTAQTLGQSAQTISIPGGNINQYLAYVPYAYNEQPKTKWPVIIFLHGLGEIGTDVNAVKRNGLPKFLDNEKRMPALVFSPQCNGGGWWNTQTLEQFLKQVVAKYNADPKRIYLTGLSMGGIETWTWAIQDPASFAAISPVSANGNPWAVGDLKNTPAWVFHGDQDPIVGYGGDVAMVNALKADGGNVQFTTVKGGKHDIWDEVYTNPALYEWMLNTKLP